MGDALSNYWEECVASSFDEHGVTVTTDKLAAIARDIELAHEMYGEAHGHYAIPNPLKRENDELSRKLKEERAKVVCRACTGRGRISIQGPYHSSDSECEMCRGEGKVQP